MNKFTGDVPLELAGEEYTLNYDWRAIAALQSTFGEDALEKVQKGSFDPHFIAEVIAMGLKRHHPEMDADKVLDASPPIVQASDAIRTAIYYALIGPEEFEAETEKKNRAPKTKKTRSKRR